MDCSPPGSPIPGILQARTLEQVAISFSNAWKWKWSCSVVSDLATPWTAAYQAPPSMGSSRQEYWSGVPLPSPVCHYLYGWNCFHVFSGHWGFTSVKLLFQLCIQISIEQFTWALFICNSFLYTSSSEGFPGSSDSKETACNSGDLARYNPWVRKIPWRREWQLTLVFLPGKSPGQRSLVGYSPWGHKELDRTERLTLSLNSDTVFGIYSNNFSPAIFIF